MMQKGFSLLEILITIFIASILLVITVNYMNDLKQDKVISGIAELISASLEETKTKAQAGLNGEQHGIKFQSNSYVIFEGSTYNPEDPNNISKEIDSNFEISTDLEDSNVIFSRIKGEPSSTGYIRVTLTEDVNTYIELNIGELGDIAVIE